MLRRITFFSAVLVLMLAFGSGLQAQLNQGGTPPGLKPESKMQLSSVEYFKAPYVDVDALKEEDKIWDTIPDVPFRFGENLYVDLNPANSGKWAKLDDGTRVWQLGVISKGALSINLTFDRYHLPEGARLFIYRPDGKEVLGAFTHQNNQEDGSFATTLVSGDEIIIEYVEPVDVAFEGELNLWRVTHGYRGPGSYFDKGFGDSGWCNYNVACPESEGWEDQIRSVGMLVTGGNGFCTGSLVNNTENDGTPYFLSADHCHSNPSNLVFWFNWQSETCEDPDEIPSHDAVSGAVDRARHSNSDFWLMEFNDYIPEEYNVYFSGWNRSMEDIIEGTVVGIHHPSADIKKFSWAESGVQAASYLGDPGSGTTHWRVGPWSGESTTEPGSSGSPIYDPQGRVLGQLHGGYAACGNTDPDWYGRLGVSWTGGDTDATRLSTWLDPNGTDVEAIFGFDPILDAADPDAPDEVVDLEVIADPQGALSAQLTWTNPSLTFDGETLTELDSVKIFRDGEMVMAFDDPVIGEDMSYTDTDLDEAGNYTYQLRAANTAGDGPPSNVTVFIGSDTPGAVSNIQLVDDDNNGYLTWDAPTEGQNLGYYDPQSLIEYQITRNPDNATFEVDASETVLLDETLPGIGFYSYTIVPVNDQGAGASATSEEVLLAAEGAVFMHSGTVTTCEGTFFDSGGPDNNYENNEDHVLTFFPEDEGAKINMQFVEFNTETNYDFLTVYDGDETDPGYLVGQFSGSGVPDELVDITSTHSTGALTFHFTSDHSITRPGWQANIGCFIPADDDLAATHIAGNFTPSVGLESVYTIGVLNPGFVAQDDYQVNLRDQDDNLLATVAGEYIEPGEEMDYLLAWTPEPGHQGNMQIYGEVELEGDANPDNNQTDLLSINVLSEGTQVVTIGDQDLLPGYRLPFDFWWKNSLAQTIYFEDEIGLDDGAITGVVFFNSFNSNLPNKDVRIYITHTQEDQLPEAFMAVDNEQLVFEGAVDFPAGENEIYIPFEEPFEYQGGNILMTTHREFEDQYHSSDDKFFISETPDKPSRTVQFNSDSEMIDPENPPVTGSITNRDGHPNIALYFDTEYEPPVVHTVNFHVDMSNVPSLVFDPEVDNLYITGSMIEWPEPGSDMENQLMEPSDDDPMVYTLSLEVEEGTHEYKYFVNEGWQGGEWPGEPNRVLEVDGEMDVFDLFANQDEWPMAQMQLIHNAADAALANLDILVNGKSFVDNLYFRHASTFLDIPANYDLTLQVASSGDRTIILDELPLYIDGAGPKIAVLNGIYSDTGYDPLKPLELFLHEGQMASGSDEHTQMLAFHGSTDAPHVSIWEQDGEDALFDFEYGDFAGYLTLETQDDIIEVRDASGTETLATYQIPLETLELGGEAIVAVASGFLHPENNSDGAAFGLWVATTGGGILTELPLYDDTPDSFPVLFTVTDETGSYEALRIKGEMTDPQWIDVDLIPGMDNVWTVTLDVYPGTYQWGITEDDGTEDGQWLLPEGNLQFTLSQEGEITDGVTSYVLTDVSVTDLEAGDIRLFPNPAEDLITLQSPAQMKQIHISDITGRVVYSEILDAGERKIQTHQFESGMYIVRILTDEGLFTGKLQITR